ncbi:drug/metabolite transporter (DMT)-like permease [Shimia isoporae]|uniref:Drug/metabolite transporter (DMT)-like permease n=1 Tax=Shimia isoporae TaxID=647720 RepID=A0A4R1N554_9RHOB|nr:DMT family transporter [Shimia isoporae]TCL01162.1 drug/metabolite transporter (DMT)-like permease [Shimia isoporae]
MADADQGDSGRSAVTLAVGLMLAANALFTLTDTSTKWLLAAGFGALQLAFMRYAVQCAITCITVARGDPARLRLPQRIWAVLFFRAGLLVGATIVNFVALKFLSLTVTSAIMFSAPIFVCLLSGPLLGEHIGTRQWAFVGIGFAGVLVVIRPFDANIEWAAAMMLIPALSMAFYSILTRKLAGDVHPAIMQLALGIVGTVCLAPLAVTTWHMPDAPLEWGLIFAIGTFAWAGHEFLIRAHKLAEAHFLMPFSYSYLVYMAVASAVVFGDAPDLPTLMGAGLITLSGILIWHNRRQSDTQTRQ